MGKIGDEKSRKGTNAIRENDSRRRAGSYLKDELLKTMFSGAASTVLGRKIVKFSEGKNLETGSRRKDQPPHAGEPPIHR